VCQSIFLSKGRPANFGHVRAQLCGLLFGQRVVDEHARAGLASRQILQLRSGPQRRIKLYVEMVVAVILAVRWPLMNDHHVRERQIEQFIVSGEQLL